MKTIAVAIDGPSGAGKSTIARAAAGHLGFVYVDTGAMYRTIGLAVCRAGVALGQTERIQSVLDSGIQVSLKYEQGVQHVLLDGEDVSASIRTPEMSKYASFVSAVPAVRAFLLQTQREMAKTHNVIMDGRDIGTVVLPDAEIKLYVTTSPEIRAKRRFDEMRAKGDTSVTLDDIIANVKMRDHLDTTRKESPLRKADDAVEVDSGKFATAEEQIAWAVDYFHQFMQGK